MAQNQKKPPQQRPQNNWFTSCFGVPMRTTSNKKSNKSGGVRKRLFKLCMPKIRVIIIRKNKVSFDSNMDALKATQRMTMVEATNVEHLNKLKHGSIIQELNEQPKENQDACNLKLNVAACHEQEPTSTTKKSIHDNKVVKDSLVGASIMVVTLIIMSIWGSLYAILCMSIWLYCVPLVRVFKDARPNLDNIKICIASKLYKKRLTLEGFLQRDRNPKMVVLDTFDHKFS